MGRPPIGKVAMTATERVRRFRAKQRADKPVTKPVTKPDTALEKELAQAKRHIAELEQHQAKPSGPAVNEAALAQKREQMLLRGENAKLKSENAKLKTMLKEAPNVAELLKKVVDQQDKMNRLRQNIRILAKERDRLLGQTEKRFREASHYATRKTYSVIVKALHSDRAKHTTAAELAEAERLFIALKPLFDEGRR
jgi:uncharacterized phage infection (PIP) family protein YhgE